MFNPELLVPEIHCEPQNYKLAMATDYKRRGRGRPRNYDMSGDLDISLIREFESRPAFYDRNNPYFKDKQYNEQAWEEISENLGYDVSLLKDRMLQLRNRYNLEKRRLEALASENPNQVIRSPWPLYEHLSFLYDHIRSRRSYRTMMTRPAMIEHDQDSHASKSQHSVIAPSTTIENDHQYAFSNGEHVPYVEVKKENGSDEDSENRTDDASFPDASSFLAQQNNSAPATPDNIQNGGGAGHHQQSNNHHQQQQNSRPGPASIAIRNPDTMKRMYQPPPPRRYEPAYAPPYAKRARFDGRGEKFEAFGKFLSTSLCDLPEHKALNLVEKFTAELVKAFVTADSSGGEKDKSAGGNEQDQLQRNGGNDVEIL